MNYIFNHIYLLLSITEMDFKVNQFFQIYVIASIILADIIRKRCDNYNLCDFMTSLVLCCWILLLPPYIFRRSMITILTISISNVLIHTLFWITGANKKKSIIANRLIYLITPILLSASILMKFNLY